MMSLRPRPALLFVPVVLVLALASMVLYHSLETDRAAERARQERFMRTAAFSVVDDLGSELFTMYSAFSLDLMARRDSGTTVTRNSLTDVVARYRAQARFPDLFQDLVCLTKSSSSYDAQVWTDRGWTTGILPDWAQGLTPPSERRDRSSDTEAFSLEKPVLTIVLRGRNPQPGEVVAVALRFSVRAVLEQVVPTLVRQRFAETQAAQPYRASVRNRNLLPAASRPVADWEVPLLPWTPFNGWFDYYLNRLKAMDRSGFGTSSTDATGTGWSLAVMREPAGLEAEMTMIQLRNTAWSAGFFLTLVVGFTGLYGMARRAGQRARQERSFLALVSHELKTPLTVVRTLGENLARGIGTDPAKAREYGSVLLEESDRLAAMVGNVLTLTAMQGGIHPEDLRPVDLGELVQKRIERQSSDNVEVTVQIHPGLTPVEGHPAAISAAVDNLIENAFRHGLSGSSPHRIRIVVEPRRRGRHHGTEFLIEDNGLGFTWAEGRRILRPFHRGERAHSAQTPGGGIGLSLIRTTAQALGGRLDWEGRPGRGARFRLWFREARP